MLCPRWGGRCPPWGAARVTARAALRTQTSQTGFLISPLHGDSFAPLLCPPSTKSLVKSCTVRQTVAHLSDAASRSPPRCAHVCAHVPSVTRGAAGRFAAPSRPTVGDTEPGAGTRPGPGCSERPADPRGALRPVHPLRPPGPLSASPFPAPSSASVSSGCGCRQLFPLRSADPAALDGAIALQTVVERDFFPFANCIH